MTTNYDEKIIVFDTNTYRCIAESMYSLSGHQKEIFTNKFIENEVKVKFSPRLNTLVAMELIQHLVKDDENPRTYEVCKTALIFARHHAGKNGCIPHPNMAFGIKFFKSNFKRIEWLEFDQDIQEVVNEISFSSTPDEVIKRKRSFLTKVANEINEIKIFFYNSILESCKRVGDGVTNWSINSRKEDKEKRRFLVDFIDNDPEFYKIRSQEFFNFIMLQNDLKKDNCGINNDQAFMWIEQIAEIHKIPFRLIGDLNIKLFGQNFNLEKEKHLRDIVDNLILFSINPLEKDIFVTGEDKIKIAAEKVGYKDTVVDSEEYINRFVSTPIRCKKEKAINTMS